MSGDDSGMDRDVIARRSRGRLDRLQREGVIEDVDGDLFETVFEENWPPFDAERESGAEFVAVKRAFQYLERAGAVYWFDAELFDTKEYREHVEGFASVAGEALDGVDTSLSYPEDGDVLLTVETADHEASREVGYQWLGQGFWDLMNELAEKEGAERRFHGPGFVGTAVAFLTEREAEVMREVLPSAREVSDR